MFGRRVRLSLDVFRDAMTLDKWLRPPIRSLESIARQGAGNDLTKAWCDEVVRPWNKLAKRYPFDPKKGEVAMADFASSSAS